MAAALMLVLAASVSRASDEQQSTFERSVALEGEQKIQEALEALNKATGPQVHTYIMELRRGWLYYLLGKYEESVTSYRRAIKQEPQSVEALLGVMLPQMALRKWVDAEKTGLAVTRLDPQSYLGNSRLAYIYYNLTRYKESAQHYARVLTHFPADIEMRSGYAWALFKQGKYQLAKAEFQAILAISPNYQAALAGINLCP